MFTTSGLIGAYLYGDRLYPSTAFYSFNVYEFSSPVGSRNLVSGSFAFLTEVGPHTTRPLEFRNVVLDFDSGISGYYQSLTECVLFRSINTRFNISNMRFWMPSGTALIPSGHIEFHATSEWLYNFGMPSGSYGVVPSSLDSAYLLKKQDGLRYIDEADDVDVSEFIYMKITVPSGYSLGRYGLGGSGTLAFAVTYDWYNII